ncbi:virulence factor Mce family protein [Mycobacteroides abscessus subsp. abscessus]|uniref:MlaD family protein n=1 Tax=Mycobacteroides abscessus TaxID=36809 RepID=UPI000927BC47|nr:MlaD family protein [Mycobacteroides abscessus]MDO3083187.1 MlaD family protein [Mycobacteroides abscessus subsp. abscessus]SHS56372.1 virulence factor Mce family protein [Mycobacteroides abscessus subsp. abscessus]SIA34801.1 virulence factor Mce family protein [Mycobacteroides abscessus subsp. abscessus]SIE10039.1 virulence factor Mce family protein [Mycobacteroides abscessus subsp. abscessus]SIE71175.1 virulence factor Mce family protein [Mycobacteroides abscessus subsp. abscessus]
MYLSKLVRRQLSVFSVVAVVAGGTMAIGYLDLPKALFGIGHYQVTVNLPSSGGLYKDGNVTYRGVEVGRVEDVRLNGGGALSVKLT